MTSVHQPRGLGAIAAAVVVGLVGSFNADAQTAGPNLPRYDIGVLGGWGGLRSTSDRDYNPWDGVGVVALQIGRYWTDHIKTEVQIQTTSEAVVFENPRAPVVVPGVSTPVFRYSELQMRVRGAAALVHYQFFRNQWFHPFLGVGVSIDVDRLQRRFPEQVVPAGPNASLPWVTLAREVGPIRTETSVRPLLAGGFKVYVAHRAFLRSDASLGVSVHERGTLRWQFGGGFDF